jgi:multidrug efflux system membrane fusion protein
MRVLPILLVAIFLIGCNDKEPEEKIRNVRTIELIESQASSRHNFNGIARSEIAARLSFNVSGTIEKVYIRDGQNVKEGDVIATLNDSYFRLKVNEVKSSLKQAKIELSNSNTKYKRVKQLYVNRSSSLSDLDNARTMKESANANYNTMKNRLEQAELKLSYTKLRAPMDGSISELKIHKGENVTTAISIASISSAKSIEVPISIPGSLIDYLKEGQTCLVTFDALKNETYKAEVVEVSHASSKRTTTFPVVVRILEKSKKVHPGMSATVRFDFQSDIRKNSFVVPLHALMEDQTGSYIYVVEDIIANVGKIKRCNVKRGELTSDGIIITDGVQSKTKVLTAGMSRVHEGQKVRVEI